MAYSSRAQSSIVKIRGETARQSGGAFWRDKSFLQMVGFEKTGNKRGEPFSGQEMGKFVARPGNGMHMQMNAAAMPVLATVARLLMTRMRIRPATGGDRTTGLGICPWRNLFFSEMNGSEQETGKEDEGGKLTWHD